MNRNWLIIEKIIAVLLTLWGIYFLYSITSGIADMFSSGYIQMRGISYGSIAAAHHLNIILGILTIFGGWLLCIKDKTGWLLSIISSAMFAINFFVSSRSNAVDNKQPFAEFYKSYGIAALIFLLIFTLLLLKPFREKYQPTAKNWFWIVSILLVLIIDKFIW